jgi:hypothetical protein
MPTRIPGRQLLDNSIGPEKLTPATREQRCGAAAAQVDSPFRQTLLPPSGRVLTAVSVHVVLRGSNSPTLGWNLRQGLPGATGTALLAGQNTGATTGSTLTTFTAATIAADAQLWLEVTSVSGTVDEFTVIVTFRP